MTAEQWVEMEGAAYIPEPNTGCWLWLKYTDHRGYGRCHYKGEKGQAHRMAYEALRGPVPDGLVLDHLCRTPGCVNPDHLEPVTPWENTRRGVGVWAQNAKKTHCLNGHPFTEENMTGVPGRGRECLTCRRIRIIEYGKKRRARERLARQGQPKVKAARILRGKSYVPCSGCGQNFVPRGRLCHNCERAV